MLFALQGSEIKSGYVNQTFVGQFKLGYHR